jgi:hypothetical protein
MRSMALSCRVAQHYSGASRVVNRPELYCCGSATACLHVLYAFNAPPAARLTCPMMVALTLDALVTRAPASVTREPSSIARVILYSCSPQSVEGHRTHVSSGAPPPPPRVERWGPELCDTRRHWSPPLRLGEVRSRRTHGNARALPCWEAGSGAVGHMAMPEPT